ncbi:MAG: hypothetical protein CMI54_05730 [Parcubacteria group bacterium]|nr:hypothetical protein [Parcubacteria group bacterium]|tara:strand:+ start:982 stop:1494 length:513 start_codon:yes stop_codon:yes gene_type:complete
MNRRDFIKAVPALAVLPTIAQQETRDKRMLELPDGEWPYRVYCYEREQGEWTFSHNTRGSFAPEREYMTFDEENDLSWNPHYVSGWMDGGVLHFQTFDHATDFVWMHSRAKDDTNLIDTIYDVYFKRNYEEGEGGVEIQVAHYWFNGDTGTQIHWEKDGFNTNFNKVELA